MWNRDIPVAQFATSCAPTQMIFPVFPEGNTRQPLVDVSRLRAPAHRRRFAEHPAGIFAGRNGYAKKINSNFILEVALDLYSGTMLIYVVSSS